MHKEDIIKILKANHYPYEETDKGIDVTVAKSCWLFLFFQDNSLIGFKEKIGNWRRWNTLRSFLWTIIIGIVVCVLLSIAVNLYIENVPALTMNVFWAGMGVSCIVYLCYYFFYLYKIKKIKKILHLA